MASNKAMRKLLLLSILFLTFSVPPCAGLNNGDFGIGINYPGIGIRYFFSNKISLEGKGQFDKDIVVGGLRGYYYFSSENKVMFFTGIESDFISFKGDVSKGNGYVGELFIGGETFFANNLSIQLDIGPAFIFLKDKDTSLKADGIDVIVNFGINYYFGKGSSLNK